MAERPPMKRYRVTIGNYDTGYRDQYETDARSRQEVYDVAWARIARLWGVSTGHGGVQRIEELTP